MRRQRMPSVQDVRLDRAAGKRHGRSEGARVSQGQWLRPGEGLGLRLRHGCRTHRDAEVWDRRHPTVLPRRCALPGAVRVSKVDYEKMIPELKDWDLNYRSAESAK